MEKACGEEVMTTLREIALSCPICANQFSSQAVLSTNSFGGKRTDFHERAVGAQPLPFLIHTCSRCGYSGTERDFGDDAEVSPMIKEHVWDELAPKLPNGSMSGSDKYEFAAKVAIWQGHEPRRVADLLLRAAWCCVDEEDTEAERYFRRQAAWSFESALSTYDGVEREERGVLTYLVAELWRRVGDQPLAQEWFERVPAEVDNPDSHGWILDAARQQQHHPREWFG
ncbi:MAG TPA: DUF2225 domain-containing protein [Gemmatimonadaceae bacterium]|nr:DUF2225 domain-containing protein [Gemmatimonadaceae bacterium]